MSPQETISTLEANLARLIAEYKRLKQDNQLMRDANDNMRAELIRTHSDYEELRKDYKKLQVASALGGNAEDRQKAKRQITEMIARIDQALALVKNNA